MRTERQTFDQNGIKNFVTAPAHGAAQAARMKYSGTPGLDLNRIRQGQLRGPALDWVIIALLDRKGPPPDTTAIAATEAAA